MFFGLTGTLPGDFSIRSGSRLPHTITEDKILSFIDNWKDSHSCPDWKELILLHVAAYGNGSHMKLTMDTIKQSGYEVDFKIKDENKVSLGYAALHLSATVNKNRDVTPILLSLDIDTNERPLHKPKIVDAILSPERRLWPLEKRDMETALHSFLERGIIPSKELFNTNKEICLAGLRLLGGSHAVNNLNRENGSYHTFKRYVEQLKLPEVSLAKAGAFKV